MSHRTDEAEVGHGDPTEHAEHTEQTPLLAAENNGQENSGQDEESQQRPTAYSILQRFRGGAKGARFRWPSILALFGLCVLVVLIIVFAFVTPSIVEQYATTAAVFEPTSLSIDSFTVDGVRARIQGDFVLDASRVKNKPVRDLGIFATWIAQKVESGNSVVEVSLPQYGNVVLGTALIPAVELDIRNGHKTHINFTSDLHPGDVDGIRRIAKDWIDGRLGELRVLGKAQIPLKSGLLSFGTQLLQHELLIASKDIPAIPSYDIKKLNIREVDLGSAKGMAADVSILVKNDYPVDLTIPELGFGILIDNCENSDVPYILVADAVTHEMHIKPEEDVEVNAVGIIRELPPLLTQYCPGSKTSPLDNLLANYIHGKETTIYVQGAKSPSKDTPQWIADLMADIIVPVPLPGRTFGHLIKSFSLKDTHFSLPNPWAEPGTPDANPRIDAKVRVLVALPKEMNFGVSVGQVRANADVFYKDQKLGQLDLDKWQKANSTRVGKDDKDDTPLLLVESLIKDAPLNITDEDVFTQVIEQFIFGKAVNMKIKALVSVGVETALGNFTIRDIPAEGQVPVKPISGKPGIGNGGIDTKLLNPKINDLRIVNTTETSLSLSTSVNVTNPTPYSATIPYFDIHLYKNGSLLGNVTVRNLAITLGNNTNLLALATYSPLTLSGPSGKLIGRELISQYISGLNTSITLQIHESSLPSLPSLGRVLSKFPVNITIPHLRSFSSSPGPPSSGGGGGDDDNGGDDDENDRPHFIKDTTMHLFTSTATFVLLSPLQHSTLYIDRINATAFFRDEDVGRIFYDQRPFGVPPLSETPGGGGFLTPRLPVDWSLGSVGYEAVRRALGGRLKLGAYAEIDVRLGKWRERVWFSGRGIGAAIRL